MNMQLLIHIEELVSHNPHSTHIVNSIATYLVAHVFNAHTPAYAHVRISNMVQYNIQNTLDDSTQRFQHIEKELSPDM
jgi:hypothetical protein